MKLKLKVIFFLLIFFLIVGCEKKEEKTKSKLKADLKSVTTNTIILKGVKFSNTQNGKIVWEIKATKAKIDKNKNIAYLDNVSIKFNKRNLKAKSKKGKYFLKTKNGELLDNVTIYSDSWLIKTNEAFLDNKDKKIILNSKFKFSGNGFYLYGSKLELLINSKKFLISGRVKTIWSKKWKKIFYLFFYFYLL